MKGFENLQGFFTLYLAVDRHLLLFTIGLA
jgi:hypothetical protein